MLVAVTDYVQPPFDIEKKALGTEAKFIFLDSTQESALLANDLKKFDALLVWHARITEKVAAALEGCRIVVRYGVGTDNLDIAALKQRQIAVCNTPDYGTEEVANTAASLLLNLWRKTSGYDFSARQKRPGWQKHVLRPIPRISESTLGVIGVGRIGSSLVQRLKAFGCRILGYDPYKDAQYAKAVGYEPVENIETLLAASDAITLHCPLNQETEGLVDTAFVNRMKPESILVNTARGRLVKNLDVIATALLNGHLSGAGLDVLPEEPPPSEHPLIVEWRNLNPSLAGRLIINPHTAYYSDASWMEMRHKAAETVRLYLKEGTLRNAVR
jgi:phosphoglycerate dehydrogenase-like enzyme